MPSKSAREYTGGSRNQRFRKIHKGQYVKERMAWVNTFLGQIALYFYEEGTAVADTTTEPGPTVKVLIPRYKGPTVHWDLSALTLEELTKLREFFDLAFDTAEPVIRMRDKVAQDAFAEGNDSISRLYRPVPQLVVRKRPEPEHSEGVLDGPENVPSGNDDGSAVNGSAGGVRGSGSGLADVGASEGGPEDDGTPTD